MELIFSYLTRYLLAYGSIRDILKDAIKYSTIIVNSIRPNYYDINAVFDEIESDSIKIGDIISLTGLFIKYGQVFKPYTYTSLMFYDAVSTGGRMFVDKNAQITLRDRSFQPPIQAIPPYNDIGCAFLYDQRFTTFISKKNHDENTFPDKDKPLIIDPYSKPMLVLYDIKNHSKFINREVDLRGKLIQIPKEIIYNLTGIYDNTISEICSNFYRPFREDTNFICISLLGEESKIRDIGSLGLENLCAPLFVETQLEGIETINANERANFIAHLLPNILPKVAPGFNISSISLKEFDAVSYITSGNINIIYKEPSIIGFYSEVLLFNEDEYRQNIIDYSTYIRNFAIDFNKAMKVIHGVKSASMKLNFLYDYQKQSIFDDRGVLYSVDANMLSKQDELMRYVQEWLKK